MESVQRVVQPEISLYPIWDDAGGFSLLCTLSGFYPDDIKVQWLQDTTVLRIPPEQKKLQSGPGKEKTFSLSSLLTLDISKWTQGSNFQCKATHNSDEFEKNISICSVFSLAHQFSSLSSPDIILETPNFRTARTQKEVTATCTVQTPFEAKISWLLDEKSTTVNNPVNLAKSTSSLTIPSSQWKNLNKITCRAEHRCFNSAQKTITLTGPGLKDPTLKIRRSLPHLLKGESAVLECEITQLSSQDVFVTFQVDGKDFGEQYVEMPVSENLQSFTIHVTVPEQHQMDDNTFRCKVEQGFSKSWTSMPTGKIFSDPSIELILASQKKSEFGYQTLVCNSEGFNPEIKWLSGSEKKFSETRESRMSKDGHFFVSSHITIPQQEWEKGSDFICQVKDRKKTDRRTINMCAAPASAQKTNVYIQGPPIHKLWTDEQLPITCLLVGQNLKNFLVSWKVGGLTTVGPSQLQPLDHDNGTQTVISTLNVSATSWHSHTNVSCEAKHICSREGQEKHTSKSRDPKPPRVNTVRLSDLELSELGNATLLCLVSEFYPAEVMVFWEQNATRLPLTHYTSSTPVQQTGTSSYFMTSRLTLPQNQWDQDSTYSCVVQHESSKVPVTRSLRSVFASMTPTPPSANLLQGSGELVCLVFGFRPAAINITWLVDGHTELWDHSTSAPYRGPGGEFIVKSQLPLPALDWLPGLVYSCRVTHTTITLTLNISKPDILEESVYFDENKYTPVVPDMSEGNWNMAIMFITLFLVSLLYGILTTLVKIK